MIKKSNNRLNLLQSQLSVSKTSRLNSGRYSSEKSTDDIVIVAYARTALTKAVKGSFSKTAPELLTKAVISGCLERSGVKAEDVNEIVFGNVMGVGSNFLKVRMSQFLSGLSEKTTYMSINRLCSSGLQAVMTLSHSIASGQVDIGIAGGVEIMTANDMSNLFDSKNVDSECLTHSVSSKCLIPMGLTSENVAEKFNITRKDQDDFAAESHFKALKAQKAGLFEKEIVPVKITIKDKDSNKEIIVQKDEGIRDTTSEALNKLKPVFKKDGTTTAGNSSQLTDGAAAVMLMKRKTAELKGLKIIARVLGYSVDGVSPEIMGIGPSVSIPSVLSKTGTSKEQIDIYEINEAFASQALFCVKHLDIPKEKVNPKGGAISLGHPLGCTGARQICTLLSELERTNKRLGVVSMCIGTGMGAAAVFELEN